MTHLPAAALSLLGGLAIAATCVTTTVQRGPEGPFVAEIANTGDQAIHAALAYSRIYDAQGRQVLVGNIGALACPSKLLPGEHGVVEIFADDEQFMRQFPQDEWELPLRAEVFRIEVDRPVGTGQARGEGLWVEELSRDPATATVELRVHNNAEAPYAQFSVCGILRAIDGTPLEVARADSPHLPFELAPGQSYDMQLAFHSFPDGYLTYHALGLFGAPYRPCCPVNGPSDWHSVDVGPFSVLLPPEWSYEEASGIDSFVGRFVGNGVRVEFDYGSFSDPLPYEGPAYTVQMETIGGYATKVVRSHSADGGMVGVHFPDLGPLVAAGARHPLRLTVSAQNVSSSEQFVVLQILRSVRFDVRPYPPGL